MVQFPFPNQPSECAARFYSTEEDRYISSSCDFQWGGFSYSVGHRRDGGRRRECSPLLHGSELTKPAHSMQPHTQSSGLGSGVMSWGPNEVGLEVATWEQRESIKKVCFLQRVAVRRIIRLFPPHKWTLAICILMLACVFSFFHLGVFRNHQPVTMRRVTLSRIFNKVYYVYWCSLPALLTDCTGVYETGAL